MTRTLPENTVDAWTAIELARQRARSIWLPTAHQGATATGNHPGDVSTLIGGRLVIIENKGIEARTSIDFGSSSRAQWDLLRLVEEAGLSALASIGGELPALGWVFYGLPLAATPPSGADWRRFPDWHHLVCPHDAGIGSSSRVRAINDIEEHRLLGPTACHCHGVPHPHHGHGWRLTLRKLEFAASVGLAGLPLGADHEGVFELLGDLAASARRAREEMSLQLEDFGDVPSSNRDGPLDLLADLAAAVTIPNSHTSIAIA